MCESTKLTFVEHLFYVQAFKCYLYNKAVRSVLLSVILLRRKLKLRGAQ